MHELLKAYASVSVSAALLVIVILLLRPLYRQKFSKRWQYYIWLIVVARFLIPWNPGNGIVGNLFLQVQEALAQNRPESSQQTLIPESFLPETSLSSQNAQPKDSATNNSIKNSKAKPTGNALIQQMSRFLKSLPAIWLLTALLLLVRKVTVYQSFVKYLKAGCSPVEDINRLEVFGKIMEQNHITRMLGLYTNCLTASPLLVGLIRPAVILTKAELSDTDFYYTVLHELTHYKRRDLFYKWLVQITVCLHWFNPFAYLMAYEVNRMCELSCDEAVTAHLDTESKRAYGDTLLRAMGTGGYYKNSLASITLGGGKQLLKERLVEIMQTKKRSKRITAAALAATVFLTGSAVATGAYAQPAAAKSQKEIRLSDCRIIEKNGMFYILSEDTANSDIPTGGVTKGCVGITLVKPDAYTSIGPFAHMDRLVRDVKQQVTQMRKKKELTAAEAKLFTQAAEKIQKDASEETYDFLRITKKNGAYYFKGSRIRIFMDQRVDGSFVKFHYDEKGEIDICLQRTEDFSTATVSYLTEDEAEAILDDLDVNVYKETTIDNHTGVDVYRETLIADQPGFVMDESDATLMDSEQMSDANQGIYVSRFAKKDLPAQVKKEVARCKDKTWYLIKDKNCTYIYYGPLKNYAFEPVLSKQKAKIKIVDMKGSGDYVLLAVYGNVPVTVTYQNKKVTCQEILLN